MVDIKDFVLDKFGIMDDVQDYADFLAKATDDFRAKAVVAERLIEEAKSEINSVHSERELRNLNLKEAFGVLRDLTRRLSEVIKRTNSVMQKAQKEPKIWRKISGDFSKAKSAMDAFENKLEQSINELVLYQREQQTVLRELEKSGLGENGSAMRPLSTRLGKLVGTIADVIAAVATVALLSAALGAKR